MASSRLRRRPDPLMFREGTRVRRHDPRIGQATSRRCDFQWCASADFTCWISSQEIVSLTPAEHLGSEDQVMIMGVDREGVLKIKNAAAWKKNLSVQFSEEEQAPKKMKEDLTKGLEEPCKQKLKSEALSGFDDAADPVKMMLD